MKDTLHHGERVIISNLFYEPKIGDIVVISRNKENSVYTMNDSNTPIIKRIIAMEGQTVDIDFEKGVVYVDGIELDEPVPDHSTISQLRRRKFSGTTIFQEIFDEIVRRCIDAGLVTGKLLLTDSTYIRANARNDLREVIEVPDTPSEYMQKLDREAFEMGLIKEPIVYPKKTKEVTKSTTDPDSGLLNRPGKPNAFCYLSHQTCDSENGIITDVYVSPGNMHDSTPHLSRIECVIEKFRFEPEAICADRGYDNCEVYHAMHQRGIMTFIPRRIKPISGAKYDEQFAPDNFIYDENTDQYICPYGRILHRSSYMKMKGYSRYSAFKSDCNACPYRSRCIGTANHPRRIERHLHETARQKQTQNCKICRF